MNHLLPVILAVLLITGCTTTSYHGDASTSRPSSAHPVIVNKDGTQLHFRKHSLESYNRDVFAFNDALDRNVYRPIAVAYRDYLPQWLRTAVGNVLSNLGDVDVTVNSALQLKLMQAGSDLLRFVVNSTIGILGIFDVATPMGLEKHNEDFGQTLGYWGVGEGHYVLLPVFPLGMTLRDWTGFIVDTAYLSDFFSLGSNTETLFMTLGIVNLRASLLQRESSIIGDRYSFIKNAYLQNRRFLVRDGRMAEEDAFLNDALDENFERLDFE